MNISSTFIERPIATSLLMAGIALFGVLAYRSMPVSDLPTVDYPTINVSAGSRPVMCSAALRSEAAPPNSLKPTR